MFKFLKLCVLNIVFIFCFDFNLFAEIVEDHSRILNPYISNIERCLTESENTFEDLNEKENVLQLLMDMRLKELEYADKYQVVTAQDSYFFAYQVIAKELYQRIQEKKFNDFEFLRAPHASLAKDREDFFKKYPSFNVSKEVWAQIAQVPVEDLLDFIEQMWNDDENDEVSEEETEISLVLEDLYALDDTLIEISAQLISANLSMETLVPADSAFDVFMGGEGIAASLGIDHSAYLKKLTNHLSEIFDHAGLLRASYEPYLQHLIEAAPKTSRGIINQIFLPKEHIEDFLYIAFPFGLLNSAHDEIVHQVFTSFQTDRLKPNFNMNKNLQVRVIAGKLFDDQVNIFRYTLIPQNEQEAYLQYVKSVIDQILLDEKNNRL